MSYAEQAARAIGEAHWRGLERAVGVMDLAITDALGQVDSSGIARENWRGTAVGTLVRQNAVLSLERHLSLRGTTLRFVERPNIGLRLITPAGDVIRIRAFPRDFKTGRLVTAKEPPDLQGSLLEPDDTTVKAAFEYGLFWTIDGRRNGIGKVCLAAADFTKKPVPDVYALVGLATRGTLAGVVESSPQFTDNIDAQDDDDYGWQQNINEAEGDDPA
jgi:hypothetical protein